MKTPAAIIGALALLTPLPASMPAAGAAQTWAKHRSHSTPQRGHGLCHAAVDEIVPAHLRAFFHRVVQRESGDDPGATYRNTNGTTDIGCAAINDIHGVSRSCRLNARCNIRFALKLYKRDGARPWRASVGGRS